MILFLVFMYIVGFITRKQFAVIVIFEWLCILWRKWEKENDKN
jgi:hypothetical protein